MNPLFILSMLAYGFLGYLLGASGVTIADKPGFFFGILALVVLIDIISHINAKK